MNRVSEAVQGFNAGMRGKKSSVYEGGHRVPFFIHWPAGGLAGGRDVSSLSAHIDVLATLAELCGVSVPESHASDGVAQRNDISAGRPNVVKELRALYMPFWKSVSPRMTPVSIDLGNPAHNPTVLCSQDWYMPKGNPPWNFRHIDQLVRVTGPWMVNVRKAGRIA